MAMSGAAAVRQHRGFPPIARETGPLSPLGERTVLVLADMENLLLGARDLGLALDAHALAATLSTACAACDLHAFFSRMPGDQRLTLQFASAGWRVHPRDIRFVRTAWGVRRQANSDNTILFFAGHLLAETDADTVVIASGDGDLVVDAARHIRETSPGRRVATLSLAGSTSSRLDARINADVSANLEIGLDCLRPRIGDWS
jgi:hypothetical protein